MIPHYEEHGDPSPLPKKRDRSKHNPPQIGVIKSKISIARRDKTKQTHRDVLFIDCVPKSTKRAFKATCATKDKTGESMRDAIIKLMRFYTLNKGVVPGQESEDLED